MDDFIEEFTPEQIIKIRKAVEVAENCREPLLSLDEVKANLKEHIRAYNLKKEHSNANLLSKVS